MKRNALFRWRWLPSQWARYIYNTARAGSAVVLGPRNQLTTAYGGPVEREKARALNNARRLYGDDVEDNRRN